MTSNVLSSTATILDRDGFIQADFVTVERLTDSDGYTLYRIGGTLHMATDVIDELGLQNEELCNVTWETQRLFLCANGGTVIL